MGKAKGLGPPPTPCTAGSRDGRSSGHAGGRYHQGSERSVACPPPYLEREVKGGCRSAGGIAPVHRALPVRILVVVQHTVCRGAAKKQREAGVGGGDGACAAYGRSVRWRAQMRTKLQAQVGLAGADGGDDAARWKAARRVPLRQPGRSRRATLQQLPTSPGGTSPVYEQVSQYSPKAISGTVESTYSRTQRPS